MDSTGAGLIHNPLYEGNFGFLPNGEEHGYLVPGEHGKEEVYVGFDEVGLEESLSQFKNELKLTAATHKDGTLRIRCYDGERLIFEGSLPVTSAKGEKNKHQQFVNQLLRKGVSLALHQLLVYSHKNPSNPLELSLLDLPSRSMTGQTEDSGIGKEGEYADVEEAREGVYALGNMPHQDEALYDLGDTDVGEAVYDMASDSLQKPAREPLYALGSGSEINNSPKLPSGYLTVFPDEEPEKKGEVVYASSQEGANSFPITVPEGLYSQPGGPSASDRKRRETDLDRDDGIYDNQLPGQAEAFYETPAGSSQHSNPSKTKEAPPQPPPRISIKNPASSSVPPFQLSSEDADISSRSILVFPCGHMCACSKKTSLNCGQNCPPITQVLRITFPKTTKPAEVSHLSTRAYQLFWGKDGWSQNLQRRAATLALGAAAVGAVAGTVVALQVKSNDPSSEASSGPSCADILSPEFNGDPLQGAYQNLTAAVQTFPGVPSTSQFTQVVASGVATACTMAQVAKDVAGFMEVVGVGLSCRMVLEAALFSLRNASFIPSNIGQAQQVVVNTGKTNSCQATTSTKPTTTSTQRTSTSTSTTTTQGTSTSTTTSTQRTSTSTSTTTTQGTSTSTTTSAQATSTSTSTTTPEDTSTTTTTPETSTSTSVATTTTPEASTSTSTTTSKDTSTSTTTSTSEVSTSTSTTTSTITSTSKRTTPPSTPPVTLPPSTVGSTKPSGCPRGSC